MTVPANALAEVVRRPERQVRLARLIRQQTTDVVPLDRVDETGVCRLPLNAARGIADIVDAHVVVRARRAHKEVVTSDPDDLRLLDTTIAVLSI